MSSRSRRRHQRIQKALAPPREKRKRCERTGKLGYTTKAAALAATARESIHIAVQRVYRCEFCRRWHLTSQEKRG